MLEISINSLKLSKKGALRQFSKYPQSFSTCWLRSIICFSTKFTVLFNSLVWLLDYAIKLKQTIKQAGRKLSKFIPGLTSTLFWSWKEREHQTPFCLFSIFVLFIHFVFRNFIHLAPTGISDFLSTNSCDVQPPESISLLA